MGAEAGYLRMIAAKAPAFEEPDPDAVEAREDERAIVLEALENAVAERDPRRRTAGKRWSAPYFVRRVAWHVLDHAWEIEDRST